jgi:hypothetical protein
MLFVLKELAGIDTVAQAAGFEDAGYDAQAVLDESAKFCGEVLAPLNVDGDRNPSSWKDGAVTATPGFGARSASSSKAAGRACNRSSTTVRGCPS